jgi:1,4-alpha-glucan branching enzyme
MSIKKQALKSKALTKVSFKLSKEQAVNASEVAIVGDFNNWDSASDVMKPLKDGSFSHAIEIANDAEYQFRYVADQTNWFNEEEADKQIASAFGSFNSVIVL